MKHHALRFALAAALCGAATCSLAGEFTVMQKDKAFSTKKLAVKVGDTVKFQNDDPFSHNVFSLSDAKSFDLGSYGKGGAKSVVFDKAGTVEIECAVHPDMKMVVEVAK
ncbi:cupredoxin domain-containing protein [Ideonella sp. BN130291]|uniref:cupredoxin domain-containing protein n=1 Tax=Ideonella sp. BN130291 TaxID=3112940 RepID=UPI002E25FD10|nr:plastocyanin/azurin family copper-binding protein [Ideonella sp. BN130291]